MASDRRMGAEGSPTWCLLLDTAERIVREKGYAAVTSRQLGKEAGLSPQIVYFYFKTMDEVFEALFKRLAAFLLEAIDEAAKSSAPVEAIWRISCDPTRSALMLELMSLANHRAELHSLIEEFGREYNRRQVAIIEDTLGSEAANPFMIPASAIASILENLARSFAFAEGFDIANHNLARELVTEFIRSRFKKT